MRRSMFDMPGHIPRKINQLQDLPAFEYPHSTTPKVLTKRLPEKWFPLQFHSLTLPSPQERASCARTRGN
jgi:hypothetical protein